MNHLSEWCLAQSSHNARLAGARPSLSSRAHLANTVVLPLTDCSCRINTSECVLWRGRPDALRLSDAHSRSFFRKEAWSTHFGGCTPPRWGVFRTGVSGTRTVMPTLDSALIMWSHRSPCVRADPGARQARRTRRELLVDTMNTMTTVEDTVHSGVEPHSTHLITAHRSWTPSF